MAIKKSLNGNVFIQAKPKKTRQGSGQHTKYSATSSNGAKKRYKGQGRSGAFFLCCYCGPCYFNGYKVVR